MGSALHSCWSCIGWVRGHRSDFDRWAYSDCAGRSWANVLPLFKKIEDWQGPPSDLRDIDGLRVADASIMHNVMSGNTNAPSVVIGEMASELLNRTNEGREKLDDAACSALLLEQHRHGHHS